MDLLEMIDQSTLDPAYTFSDDDDDQTSNPGNTANGPNNKTNSNNASPKSAPKSKITSPKSAAKREHAKSADVTAKRPKLDSDKTSVNKQSAEEAKNCVESAGESSETVLYSLEGSLVESHKDSQEKPQGEEDGPGTSKSRSTLRKIPSVAKDAENIASMLGVEDIDTIYERVEQLRKQDNRSDIVTNEILEKGIEALKEKVSFTASLDYNEPTSTGDLFEDLEKICAAVKEVYPKAVVNPNEIFPVLERYADKPERVTFVRDMVLKEVMKKEVTVLDEERLPVAKSPDDPLEILNEEHELVTDLEHVVKKFSNVDPDYIFKLIVKHITAENRVARVVAILEKDAERRNSHHKINDEELLNDPLYSEMIQVAALFPHRDHNEIYAYLEAHYHEKNRLQVVTNELIQLDQGSQNDSQKSKQESPESKEAVNGKNGPNYNDVRESWCRKRSKNRALGAQSKKNKLTLDEELQQEVEQLHDVFPEYEHQALFDQLRAMASDPDRLQKLSERLFERSDGPRQTATDTVERDIDDFLKQNPDPRRGLVNGAGDSDGSGTGDTQRRHSGETPRDSPLRRASLSSCPFCRSPGIVSDPTSTTFSCQHQECKKVSCRLCQEAAHSPLRCSEVARCGDLRSFVEARMTEAMTRVCWRCDRRFFMSDGTSRVVCPCGAAMCYSCKQPICSNKHFSGGSCELIADVASLHLAGMRRAAEEAREEWLTAHPDDHDDSGYDPVKLLDQHASGDKSSSQPAGRPSFIQLLLGFIPRLFRSRSSEPTRSSERSRSSDELSRSST